MNLRHLIPTLLLLTLTSCSLLPPRKISMRETAHIIVTEDKTHALKLRVRGCLISSVDVVTSVRATVHGPTLDLTPRAGWVRSGYDFHFDCEFLVPDTVNEVRFGTTHALIWDRRTGNKYPATRLEPFYKNIRYPKELQIDKLLQSGAYVFDWDAWLKGTSTHPFSLPVPGKVSLRSTSNEDDVWMKTKPSKPLSTKASQPSKPAS